MAGTERAGAGGGEPVRTIYDPRRVMDLTDAEWAAMVGKYVDVSMADANYWRGKAVEEWQGGAGICESVIVDRPGHSVRLRVDWGMEFGILLGQAVFLGVCDEHGDHDSDSGRECARWMEHECVRMAEPTGVER